MRIIEINIRDYGPISEFSFSPDRISCIYGANESGKTAVVEVLAYALFKRTVAHLRYPKPKHIHIVVDDQGKKLTLPSKRRIRSLPMIDIADLLYVHSSQTSVFTDSTKDRFWDSLKTMLSGMEAGITYAKLDEKIFTSVGLQPKKEQWKQEKQEQIDHEVARKKALTTYISKLSDIEHTQISRQHLEKDRKQAEQEYASIEIWKKYQKYKELGRLYDAYHEKTTHLQDYERYKPDLLEQWQELDMQKRAVQKDDSKLQSIDKEIADLGRKKMELQRKQDFIDAWDITADSVPQTRTLKPARTKLPYIISAVTAVVFILSFFTPIPVLIAAIAFTLSIGVSGFYLYRINALRRTITRHAQIMEKAQRIFPDINTMADLFTAIEQTKNEMIRISTQLTEKHEIKKHLADKRSGADIEQNIAEIRNKTGLADLQDFKAKMEKKKKLEAEQSELFGKIFGILGEKNVNRWERLIEGMKVAAPKETPDITKETDMREHLVQLDKQIQDLDKQISVFTEIQKTTYGIDDPRSAFIELDRLEKKLRGYELEKNAALAAREIFSKMSAEQDNYLQEVISGSRSLSEYFNIITDRYESVMINNKDFSVTDKQGQTYPIDTLSSGAKDQLLLCFRFATLQKAFPQGIFLFLDDAFIFADWSRRKKLMDLVNAFAQAGNQVIYFTSDDHTRELFAEYGAQIKNLS